MSQHLYGGYICDDCWRYNIRCTPEHEIRDRDPRNIRPYHIEGRLERKQRLAEERRDRMRR